MRLSCVRSLKHILSHRTGGDRNHSNKDAGCFVITEYKIGLDKNTLCGSVIA